MRHAPLTLLLCLSQLSYYDACRSLIASRRCKRQADEPARPHAAECDAASIADAESAGRAHCAVDDVKTPESGRFFADRYRHFASAMNDDADYSLYGFRRAVEDAA